MGVQAAVVILRTPEDAERERDVASALEEAWGCTMNPYGHLSPIDWYAEREGRLLAFVELKSRTRASQDHTTVYLNVGKWLALTMAALAFNVRSVFVVAFSDGTFWVDVAEAVGSPVLLKGRTDRNRNDVEPAIKIPLALFRQVGQVAA